MLIVCLTALMLTGCHLSETEKQELKETAHAMILSYVETKGHDQLVAYIDSLVEDGRLGYKNAEKIKEAIPYGIDKLKEVMASLEEE